MEVDYQEVYFNDYCKTCIYKNKDEREEPCNECIEQPYVLNSHGPINYKKGEKR